MLLMNFSLLLCVRKCHYCTLKRNFTGYVFAEMILLFFFKAVSYSVHCTVLMEIKIREVQLTFFKSISIPDIHKRDNDGQNYYVKNLP